MIVLLKKIGLYRRRLVLYCNLHWKVLSTTKSPPPWPRFLLAGIKGCSHIVKILDSNSPEFRFHLFFFQIYFQGFLFSIFTQTFSTLTHPNYNQMILLKFLLNIFLVGCIVVLYVVRSLIKNYAFLFFKYRQVDEVNKKFHPCPIDNF